MKIERVQIRQALRSDAESICFAHRDSIRSLGPAFYPADAVSAWEEGVSNELYLDAMDRGEVFFIATGSVDAQQTVLGFSSDYVKDGPTHGTSVYVRGIAARAGIGSALLRTAEAHAVERGATAVEIEASLAGVEFYRTHGYVELRRGPVVLATGRSIECVFMRKELSQR